MADTPRFSTALPDASASPGPPPRRRLRRVALVGIDGSGKTTQARHLARELAARGQPAAYWQNAGGRRWLDRLAVRLGRPDARRLLGRRVLLLAESMLRWLAIARALVRSSLGGRVAVMDRYAVCQYASIRVQTRSGRHVGRVSSGERLARLAYRLFPRPDVTFLLAVDVVEAFRRIEVRGEDHESMTYLAAADAAYRGLPEYATFVVLDANRPPDEVAEAIRAHLAAWLPDATPAPSMPIPPVDRQSPPPGPVVSGSDPTTPLPDPVAA